MWTQPWLLSIVSGLIFVAIAYWYYDKQEEKKPTNVQYSVIFLLVAGLVYGSFLIANNKNNSSGGCGDDLIYTGSPQF